MCQLLLTADNLHTCNVIQAENDNYRALETSFKFFPGILLVPSLPLLAIPSKGCISDSGVLLGAPLQKGVLLGSSRCGS